MCSLILFSLHTKDLLKPDSHLLKQCFIWFNESPLKMMKNVFYFIWRAFFVLERFKYLSWLFSHIKNGLIRRISLISKFMTLQPGQQKNKLHILPSISQWLDKQTIKQEIIFFKNHAKIEAGRLVPGFSLFFKKSLYEVDTNGLQLSINIFSESSTWHTIKANCIKL